MKIWDNFLLALSKFTQFDGRSRRAEFWSFWLITMLIGIVASRWDGMLFDNNEFFEGLVNLIFFLPTISVGARRLHDIGRSGWWQLIALTGIGCLGLLYWYAKDGDEYPNKWGISPKYGDTEADYGAPLHDDNEEQIL